jgi:hypothetical protein
LICTAKLNKVNKEGKTELHKSAESNRYDPECDACKAKAKEEDSNKGEKDASLCSCKKDIGSLLDKNMDPNIQDKYGEMRSLSLIGELSNRTIGISQIIIREYSFADCCEAFSY